MYSRSIFAWKGLTHSISPAVGCRRALAPTCPHTCTRKAGTVQPAKHKKHSQLCCTFNMVTWPCMCSSGCIVFTRVIRNGVDDGWMARHLHDSTTEYLLWGACLKFIICLISRRRTARVIYNCRNKASRLQAKGAVESGHTAWRGILRREVRTAGELIYFHKIFFLL